MEKNTANKDRHSNQNIILTVCFSLAGGGIPILINSLYDKSLSYSLIPAGLTLISWFLSIISGLIFLVKRGNNSGRAASGEQVPLHPDYYKAPKFITGQLYLFIIGAVLLFLWFVWHLLSNTFTWIPN